MTKVPIVKGKQVVSALSKAGWSVKSQKGSHVKLVKPGIEYHIVVASHGSSTIPVGTLSGIIKDAGLTVDEFVELLKRR